MSDPSERMSAESYRKLRADVKLVKETEWMRVFLDVQTELPIRKAFNGGTYGIADPQAAVSEQKHESA